MMILQVTLEPYELWLRIAGTLPVVFSG